MIVQKTTSNPAMLCLLEEMQDNPGAVSAYAASGAAAWALGEIGRLWKALHESVRLQSHYAQLLNQMDGGERRAFSSAEAWITRMQEVGMLK